MQQLEVLESPRARQMRAAAQVDERSVGIQGDRLVVCELVEPLQLERVVLEPPLSYFPIHLLALEPIVRPNHLTHLRLDRLEIIGRERSRHLEVVVEPVLDCRPEPNLRFRVELSHRGRQHMRGRVPQHVERRRIAVRQNLERDVFINRAVQVPHLAADARGDRSLRETRADLFGYLARRSAGRYVTGRPVWQGNANGFWHR